MRGYKRKADGKTIWHWEGEKDVRARELAIEKCGEEMLAAILLQSAIIFRLPATGLLTSRGIHSKAQRVYQLFVAFDYQGSTAIRPPAHQSPLSPLSSSRRK
jgi:hypothetical protein